MGGPRSSRHRAYGTSSQIVPYHSGRLQIAQFTRPRSAGLPDRTAIKRTASHRVHDVLTGSTHSSGLLSTGQRHGRLPHQHLSTLTHDLALRGITGQHVSARRIRVTTQTLSLLRLDQTISTTKLSRLHLMDRGATQELNRSLAHLPLLHSVARRQDRSWFPHPHNGTGHDGCSRTSAGDPQLDPDHQSTYKPTSLELLCAHTDPHSRVENSDTRPPTGVGGLTQCFRTRDLYACGAHFGRRGPLRGRIRPQAHSHSL
jgi:hypothetical protein